MRISIISFTKGGSVVCGKLVKRFRELGENCGGYVQKRFLNELQELPGICAVEEPVGVWSGRMFADADALIYIGAAGIAVRAIAPYLKDKMTDPAVLVIDEQGQFVISLLSGHVGGANRLAARAAEMLGAVPVITTASDVRGLSAVDVWAKDCGLILSDRVLAKRAAAELVNGGAVGFYSDYPMEEPVPEGYMRGQMCPVQVWVTVRRAPDADRMLSMFLPEDAQILRLIPKILVVGIGCRRKITEKQVEQAVCKVMQEHNLDERAAGMIASIDLKRNEEGLCAYAKRQKLPFCTWSAEELETVRGDLSESEFVRTITGTGNVCERAALLAAGPGARLLVRKHAYDGVTVAVAERDYRVARQDKTETAAKG